MKLLTIPTDNRSKKIPPLNCLDAFLPHRLGSDFLRSGGS
jgi:hypothetical protein